MLRKKGGAARVETSDVDTESVYSQAYEVLMVHCLSSLYIDCDGMAEAFISETSPSSDLYVDRISDIVAIDTGVRISDSCQPDEGSLGLSSSKLEGYALTSGNLRGNSVYKTTIEEVEDEFYVTDRLRIPALSGLLEEVTPDEPLLSSDIKDPATPAPGIDVPTTSA
jgi:hypothetical protein